MAQNCFPAMTVSDVPKVTDRMWADAPFLLESTFVRARMDCHENPSPFKQTPTAVAVCLFSAKLQCLRLPCALVSPVADPGKLTCLLGCEVTTFEDPLTP